MRHARLWAVIGTTAALTGAGALLSPAFAADTTPPTNYTVVATINSNGQLSCEIGIWNPPQPPADSVLVSVPVPSFLAPTLSDLDPPPCTPAR